MGIGPGSPDASWASYAHIDPVFREMLETLYTPAAFKALHYYPETFKRLFELPGMAFERLDIFRKTDDGSFIPLISDADRAPYLPIFDCARPLVRSNHRAMLQNLIARRTDDIGVFVNMGLACESSLEWLDEDEPQMTTQTFGPADHPRLKRRVLRGFFPYLSNHSVALSEIMFFFTNAETDRLALVTAPDDEREAAIAFIRARGVMQGFIKVCAQCGKTGHKDLLKCSCCRAVRYCCAECQHRHWPLHKEACELRRV